MASPYDDREMYDPYGVPLPVEERIRRLMEKRRQEQQAAIPAMLADEMPSADMLGTDIRSFGMEAVQSPLDGSVTYRKIPPKPPVPYVGNRQGRG